MSHQSRSTTVRLRWYEVWKRALWPSIEGFEGILNQRQNIKLKMAAGWVVVTTVIGTSTLVLIAIPPAELPLLYRYPLLLVVSLVILIPVGELLLWIFFAGSGHVLASLLGGARQFRELAYVYAAFLAPLTVIDSVMSTLDIYFGVSESLSPSIPIAWLLFEAYRIVLAMVAVRALYRFGWVKAFICVLPIVVSGLLYLLIWV